MSFSIDRRVFYGILTVLGFAAALAAGVYFGRQAGSPATSSVAPAAPGVVAPAADGGLAVPTTSAVTGSSPADDPQFADLKRIEIADAFARFEKADALFVDSRSADQFVLGHIPNSVNIPYTEAATRFTELPTDKDIIVYCACPHAEESARGARAFVDAGMTRISVMWDGLNAWTADGHPTDPPPGGAQGGITSPGAGITMEAPVVSTVVPAPPAP